MKVWTIYRAHCTTCGEIKEFPSGQAAQSYALSHQRTHDKREVGWASSTPENVETVTDRQGNGGS